MNGDGYRDWMVGAPSAKKVYVYYGAAGGLSNSPGWSTTGEPYDGIGWSVSTAGDVTGDGFSDIIIGAPWFGAEPKGAVFVYYGGPSGPSEQPVWSAFGEQIDSIFGDSISTAGDLDGDGYSDIIIGSFMYSAADEDPRTYEGRVYIFYGGESGLSNEPVIIDGDKEMALLGFSVATAGDVDGDGFSDIIIGTTTYPNEEGEDVGRVFVYYGSPSREFSAALSRVRSAAAFL